MASSGAITSIIIIILIVVFLLFILFIGVRRNPEFIFGTIFRVQQGVTSGTTDTFNTSLFDLYIGNSSSPVKLTITASTNNIIGREIIIRNNTNHQITFIGGDGVTFSKSNQLTTKVDASATLVVVDRPNNFLRIA